MITQKQLRQTVTRNQPKHVSHNDGVSPIETLNDHDKLKQEISLGNNSNIMLRLLMNSLESYRQARKIGWSRPWNKNNLMNFQSFRLHIENDLSLLTLAEKILHSECTKIPDSVLEFIDSLLQEHKQLMGFIFIHEHVDDGKLFEGATLSLGRKNKKRYRDRLDIIVESPIIDSRSFGLQRLRIYVDPYTDIKEPLWSQCIDPVKGPHSNTLFSQLSEISTAWQHLPEKHWKHWTSDYIDYFGPRRYAVENSYFYQNHAS